MPCRVGCPAGSSTVAGVRRGLPGRGERCFVESIGQSVAASAPISWLTRWCQRQRIQGRTDLQSHNTLRERHLNHRVPVVAQSYWPDMLGGAARFCFHPSSSPRCRQNAATLWPHRLCSAINPRHFNIATRPRSRMSQARGTVRPIKRWGSHSAHCTSNALLPLPRTSI